MRILSIVTFALVLWTQYTLAADEVCFPGRCNQYILDHLCDRQHTLELKEKFASNETDVFVGVSIALTTFIANWLKQTTTGILCSFEYLNNSTDILPGVTLHPVFADDRTFEGVGAGLCLGETGIPVSVGPSTSSRAIGVASMGKVFGTHHIGIMVRSDELSNKDPISGYPTFSRVSSGSSLQSKAIVSLCKAMNWRRVSTITTADDALAQGTTSRFIQEANSNSLSVLSSVVLPEHSNNEADVELKLNVIKESGSRVVYFAISLHQDFKQILRVAKRLKMLDSGWVWLISETFSTVVVDWLADEYVLETNGIIFVQEILDESVRTEGSHYDILRKCMDQHELDTDGPYVGQEFGIPGGITTHAYDAVILAGLLIDRVGVSNIHNMGAVREAMTGIRFVGSTGNIEIDAVGDRSGSIFRVENVQMGKAVAIGTVNSDNGAFNPLPGVHKVFPGNLTEPPMDFWMDCNIREHYKRNVSECTSDDNRIMSFTQTEGDAATYCPSVMDEIIPCDHPTYSSSLFPLVFQLLGLLLNFVILVMTLYYWKHSVIIRGQRPWLLLNIVGGIVAQCATLFAYGKPTVSTCNVPTSMLVLGIVLQFATLATKSWRVAKVLVKNKALKRVFVKDVTMARNIAVVVSIGAVLMSLVVIIDAPQPQQSEVTTVDGLTYPVLECRSKQDTYSTMLLVYIAILMLYTCKVSYEIRNVTEHFSEAFYIFLATYNSTLCALAGFSFTFLANPTAQRLHMVITIVVTIGTTCNTGLLMIPKFHMIHRDYAGTSMITGTKIKGEQSTAMNNYSNSNKTVPFNSLDARVRLLECLMVEHGVPIPP